MERKGAVGMVGIMIAAVAVAVAGCATTRAAQEEQETLRVQVGGLQTQVAALTSQVEELRSRQQTLEGRAWDEGFRVAPAVEPRAGRRPRAVLTAKEIQLALQRAGYYQGSVDGKIGQKTRSALKTFQAANNLVADGVAGAKTMTALRAYLIPEESGP